MAATRMCARSLALLGLFGQSRCFEDAASLIQQRQAVEAMDASSELQGSARAVPVVGSDGIHMSRLSASAESGSNIIMNFSNFCDEGDSFGPTECALYFNMPLQQTFKFHLDGGLRPGDAFDLSFNVSLDYNKSNFFSAITPQNTFARVGCELCTDSCHFSMTKANLSLNVTTPTVLDSLPVCDGSATTEDFNISNRNIFGVKPPAALALSGDITVSAGIFKDDGSTRAQGKYLFHMTAPASSGSLASGADEGTNSALDMLMKAFFDKVTGSAKGSSSIALKDFLGSAAHVLELNLTVNSMASGSMSISASEGCTSTGASGSVACKIPLVDGISVSSAADLSFTAAEGGTVTISSKPSVGGNLGIILGERLRRREMTVPACGTAPVEVVDLNGANSTVTPARCGEYALQFSSVAQLASLADFGNFDLPRIPFAPFLPRTFDDMLPLSVAVGFDMKAPDNTTMISFELAIGISLQEGQ